MARNNGKEKEFTFDIDNYSVETRLINCFNCSNNCEIVAVYKNNDMVDMGGNKCDEAKKKCKDN
jgi:hypothetical protein